MKPLSYCPSCGRQSLVNPLAKEWCCTSCDFRYFHNMASAVAGIIVCADEVLLTVRKFEPGKGLLDLPGGFVDYGESLEQGMAREAYEELGVKNLDWQYLCSFANQYRYADILYHTQDAIFVAQVATKPQMKPQDDVADLVWVNKRELNFEAIAFVSIRSALQQFLS